MQTCATAEYVLIESTAKTMMNEFLNKISQLFSKDILFASLLPALLFLVSVFSVFLTILGFGNILVLYDNLSTNGAVFLTFTVVLLLIVFAYVLHSIRGVMLSFWSGDSILLNAYFYIARKVHYQIFLKRYDRLYKNNWSRHYDEFIRDVEDGRMKDPLPAESHDALVDQINKLKPDCSEAERNDFLQKFLNTYKNHSARSMDKILQVLSDRIYQWSTSWKAGRLGELLMNSYEGLRRDMNTVSAEKKVNIGRTEEIDLLHELWKFSDQSEESKVGDLFAKINDAYAKYSADSLLHIQTRLLEIIHSNAIQTPKIPGAADWDRSHRAFLADIAAIPQGQAAADKICPKAEKHLRKLIREVKADTPESSNENLFKALLQAYKKYSRESLAAVNKELSDRNEILLTEMHNAEALLDRQYAALPYIKGSQLGNIIQSYHDYSFKRYRMEAEIFWPRLQHVIGDKYNGLLENQKVSLDFSITCATLASVFVFLCALGPWIYTNVSFWFWLGIAGLVVTFLCYQMAINAAEGLGNLVRSAYDLFRLKLLKSLNLSFPQNTGEEREIWESYSRTITFSVPEVLQLKNDEK